MKIIKVGAMAFEALLPGDVFQFEDESDEYFMKIEPLDEWVSETESCVINAINLSCAEACDRCPISDSEKVIKVNCELRIK